MPQNRLAEQWQVSDKLWFLTVPHTFTWYHTLWPGPLSFYHVQCTFPLVLNMWE